MALNAPIDLADVLLMAMMLVGVALRYWCYHKLGRLFTYTILVKPNHELVRDGPYTLLLHPSYTAQVGVMCCYLLFMFRWKTLFWLPLIAYVLHKLGQRMRIEEDHLSRLLPAYDAYKQERWRLIPFVY
jgi:protein-S-isoprenylcysteine O-methyltransferase